MTSREAKRKVCRAIRNLMATRDDDLETSWTFLLERDDNGRPLPEKDMWRMYDAFGELLDEMYRRGGVD